METKDLEQILTENVFSSPEKLLVCRVCLQSDVKLFDLLQSRIKDSFVCFSETPVTSRDGIPQYICYSCFATLHKALRFKSKCQRTYKYLMHVCSNNMITADLLNTKIKPQSSFELKRTLTETIDVPPNEFWIADGVKDETSIKEEDIPFNNLEHNIQTYFEPLNSIYNEIKNEDSSSNTEEINETETRESLRQFIGKKICNKRETAEGSDHLEGDESAKGSEDLVDDNEEIDTTETKSLSQSNKRKLRSLCLSEQDFVVFAKKYDVDVVVLTKEEQMEREIERSEAQNNYEFTCDTCNKGFKLHSALKNHLVLHDLSRGCHICEVCKIRFNTKKRLYDHSRLHKIEFVCKICGQTNNTMFTARSHHLRHKGQKFVCKYCNKECNAWSTKDSHEKAIHKPVTCDTCLETVSGTNALALHKKTVHFVMTSPCSKCEVNFETGAALKRHKCDISLKSCGVCGISVGSQEELSAHIRDKHHNTVFKCTMCPQTFTSAVALNLHSTRGHLDINPEITEVTKDKVNSTTAGATTSSYMCEICAKSYSSATVLKYHQRIHTGEKPFHCSTCQKKFRLHEQLKQHMLQHTGEKPYKCKLCPDTFKSLSNLGKHKRRRHTKERPHKCHLCEKAFYSLNEIKDHVNYVHLHEPRPPRRKKNKDNL